MKTYFTLLCFLMSSLLVKSQTYNSTCTPSETMVKTYRNDAYLLAIKRVIDIGSPWKDSVNVPEIYIDSMARALYAMQNMDYTTLRDTIYTLFGDSNFVYGIYYPQDSLHMHDAGDLDYSFRMKAITITVLDTDMWSSAINQLISKYNLSVSPEVFQPYADKKIYKVQSALSINTLALRKQFLNIAGVIYAEGIYRVGSGNSISANIVNGEVLLTYTIGCGDCPAGCTYGRIWDFKVNISSGCQVEYISAHNWGLIVVLPEAFQLCTPTVLPVAFTSIKVSQRDYYQLIEWKMDMEDDVPNYIIERSADGVNYIPIGQINKTHPSTSPVNYAWKDATILEGKIYYRIKMTGISGIKKYSPVAFIQIRPQPNIRVFPTLVTNNIIHVQFNKVEKESYKVDLVNTAGQILFSTDINVNVMSLNRELTIPKIANGIYVLSIRSKTRQSKQVVYISQH